MLPTDIVRLLSDKKVDANNETLRNKLRRHLHDTSECHRSLPSFGTICRDAIHVDLQGHPGRLIILAELARSMLKRLIKRTKRLNRDCTSVLTSVDLHISRSSVLSNESATLLEMLFPPVWGKCARLESDLTCPACQVHRYAGRTYGQIMLSGRQRRKGCHPLRSVASSYPLANTRDQCEGLRQNLQMMPTRWLHLLDQLPERMKYWKQLRMVSFYCELF
jgi:hypothetical protein